MTIQEEWWKDFFSDRLLDVLRQSKTVENTLAEADFIEKTIRIAPPAKVLDVPCGGGRLCIELAARGYEVTGVDVTRSLLDDADRNAKERHLDIKWEHRDMRNLPWQQEFDGAFCLWGSFGYFDEKGDLEFLSAIHRALKPGAKFLVDTHITETLLPSLFHERGWKRVGETLVLEERHYDHVSARTKTEFTLVQNSKVSKKVSSIRLYTFRELCGLFQIVGFGDFKSYGSLAGESFRLGSPRLYLIATNMNS